MYVFYVHICFFEGIYEMHDVVEFGVRKQEIRMSVMQRMRKPRDAFSWCSKLQHMLRTRVQCFRRKGERCKCICTCNWNGRRVSLNEWDRKSLWEGEKNERLPRSSPLFPGASFDALGKKEHYISVYRPFWQTGTSRDISSDTVEAAALSHAYTTGVSPAVSSYVSTAATDFSITVVSGNTQFQLRMPNNPQREKELRESGWATALPPHTESMVSLDLFVPLTLQCGLSDRSVVKAAMVRHALPNLLFLHLSHALPRFFSFSLVVHASSSKIKIMHTARKSLQKDENSLWKASAEKKVKHTAKFGPEDSKC